MKVAALDLGSNTFLCLICEVKGAYTAKRVTQVYADHVEVVRLGQDLSKTKKFHPEALARADQTLNRFSQIIREHRPQKVLAMATAAARDAENKQALFDLCAKYNIPLEIISGDNEASITYQGAIGGMDLNQNRLVVDIGGRSTECIFGAGLEIKDSHSFNIGCVSLTEKFISRQPTTDDDVKKCEAYIKEVFAEKKVQTNNLGEIVAVAGTPTSLVAAQIGFYDPDLIDGYILNLKELLEWKIKLQAATVDQKIAMGIEKGRADVIFVGVLILIEILRMYNQDYMRVSTRGVRYGIALSMA